MPSNLQNGLGPKIMIALIIILLIPAFASAQTVSSPILTFAPHCTEEDRSLCPEFSPVDARTLTTAQMQVGDILDVDIVVKNIGDATITTVRSWVNYDPAVLEARSVTVNQDVLTSPIPGEAIYEPAEKVVKIGGTNMSGIGRNDVWIARVTFRVLSKQATNLTFKGYEEFGRGETALRHDQEENTFVSVMKVEPASLRVAIEGATSSVPAMPISSAATSMPTQSSSISSSAMNSGGSAFSILQVQNIRVTSQDGNLFIGWDELRSTGLKGYNVYYGTVSGRYLQRRSLPKTSRSLAVRGLEQGIQYFVSVRGYDENNQETAFSQEESVVIGKPETSTAPLLGAKFDGPDGNPVQNNGGTSVPGETGVGSTLALLFFAAAGIGTFFAWRRQLKLTPND